MTDSFSVDLLLDALAKRVAAEVRAELAQSQTFAVRPRLLSLEQAGAYIGRSKQAVEHMVRQGRLPSVRTDRRIFLDVRDLDLWIDENKTAGPRI